MDKVLSKIYVTDDYSKFKKLTGNRDVKGTKKILNSIEHVGYVLSPILVNEKMEVIDGQNRLEALKQLGLDVPYMIQDGIGIDECRHLNIGQMNWTTIQFIESYANSGNESYIRLYDLISDFKKQLSVEGVLCFSVQGIINLDGGGRYKAVRDGEIVITNEQYEQARRDITSVIALGFVDFKEKFNMAGRTFWASVAYAYHHPDVDPEELILKMKSDPNAIVSCAKLVDQLRYFDDAYNKNKRASNRVFMSSDIQKGLHCDFGGVES